MKIIKKGAKFHTVGTNANSYIKRLNSKYQNSEYFITSKISSSEIKIVDVSNDKVIDCFTSTSTFNQFVNSMLAYGFLSASVGKYKININLSIEDIWGKILEKDGDKNINILRQSRIISLLTLLNIINKDNFEEMKISGKRGETKITNIKKETCKLEKELVADYGLLLEVLERIKAYEFKN